MALTIKIRGDATHLEKTLQGVKKSVSGLGAGLLKFGAAGAGFAATTAGINGVGAVTEKLGTAIKDASAKASDMENLSVQFGVLTKSADKAKGLIESFRQEAQKSPLSVKDYAEAGKNLMSFGVSADDTLPVLKMIGDVSMGNAERFSSLALAFAQTQAAGRLMGQEVLQFVNAGFNPLQEISRKTGRSMIELKKAMEDGAISSDMVTEAFRSATSSGGLFFGAIQKGAATFDGKMAKMRDSVDSLKIAFGTGMNEGLKNAIDAANSSLPELESQFVIIGQSFGKAITDGVNGNFDIFLQAGLLMGEAIKQGIMDVVGNAPVDAIRGFTQSTSGLVGPSTQAAAQVITDAAFGPQRTIGQRAEDIKSSLAGPVRQLEETITRRDGERMIEELIRNRQATERLIEKGIKITRENLAQEMFSR